jgi:hypothetical protein
MSLHKNVTANIVGIRGVFQEKPEFEGNRFRAIIAAKTSVVITGKLPESGYFGQNLSGEQGSWSPIGE